jgi:thiamine-phosphate pyrophosphorylase
VTDPHLAGGGRSITETVRQALEAGVRAIQLRDKTATDGELLSLAVELRSLCGEHGALFLVNDRVWLAQACFAHGVHLGQDDMAAADARRVLGPEAVIGVSVRTVEEARTAERAGADYVAANMVFATATKTDLPCPLGLEAVRDLKAALGIPLVAIGGITPENAALVRAAGADGLAVVSAIMSSPDVPSAVLALLGTLLGT